MFQAQLFRQLAFCILYKILDGHGSSGNSYDIHLTIQQCMGCCKTNLLLLTQTLTARCR